MKWTDKKQLGRTDHFHIPEVGLVHLSARIDTGAAYCALHCASAQVSQEDNSLRVVMDNGASYSFTEYKKIAVKSSFGESQERFAVLLTISIYRQPYRIWVGLTAREKMRYPLLVGRNLLREGFVVDVKKRNLSYRFDLKYTV